MRAVEFITEIDRRNVLKGLAAGGLMAAAAGSYLTKKDPVRRPTVGKVVNQDEPEVDDGISKAPNTISNRPELEKLLINAASSANPPLTGVELAAFLAQCFHESDKFNAMREYGGPKRFKRLYDITTNPRLAKILGNLHIGDGIRYHGRGFIQLTGRENYRNAGKALGIDLEGNPELAVNPKIAAKIAVWYWNTRVRPYVNDFTDTGAVTRKINAKLKGLDSREAAFRRYLETMR